jgi:hypothetical protein
MLKGHTQKKAGEDPSGLMNISQCMVTISVPACYLCSYFRILEAFMSAAESEFSRFALWGGPSPSYLPRPQLKTASANWGRHSSPHIIIIIIQASTHHQWDKISQIHSSMIILIIDCPTYCSNSPVKRIFFPLYFLCTLVESYFSFCMSTWAVYE